MEKIKKITNFIKKLDSFYDKDLFRYASSLSFHTTLSLFPILMVSLAIFTQMPSFNEYYEKIKNFIFSNIIPTNQDIIVQYIEQFLANSVNLGIFGFVAVVLTAILFFNDFEQIIAKISNSQTRSFFKSLSTYWTLMTLAPFGLGISFYISSSLQNLLNQNSLTSWINLLSIFPYLIIWVIFAVSFAIAINKEILPKSIIISSFITSICWWILKILFIQYVLYNKTYLSIYGSFSVLFFFLLWIYLSWILFLHGIKICLFLDEKYRKKT